MSTTTTTGTLAAGESRTFTLAPGAAVSLTLLPNVRVTITETPESVSGSGVGGNTTRVHEPQLPGTFAYGPYPLGGSVVVAVASNSGSSVAWTRKDTVVTTNEDGTSLVSGDEIIALSEVSDVVNLTATGTAFSGPCEFAGFVVRSESGGTADITIYDALSATGTAIMTVTNVTVGAYLWAGDWATPGVGANLRRANVTGCHVVISGTANIDVLVG